MASNLVPKSRKQAPEQTPTYNIQNGGRLNSEKETYVWRTHSIIGISQKRHWRWRLLLWHRGRANNTFIASQHQGWLLIHSMLIHCCRNPHQGRSHSHWWNRWQPRRHHHNWRSSSHSLSRNVRHNELQECTRISTWTPHVLMLPKPQQMGEHPPNPWHQGNIPHVTYRYPQHIPMHREANEWVGDKHRDRHPHTGGGVKEVSNM